MSRQIEYIANKKTVYHGRVYQPGEQWLAEDCPGADPPPMGGDWSIRQLAEEPARGPDSIVTGSSRGGAFWKAQPDRPRAAPLTEAEKAILAKNPYANLDEVPAAPVPTTPDPPRKKSLPIVPYQAKTREEIEDPFGLKARAREAAEIRKKEADPGKEEATK